MTRTLVRLLVAVIFITLLVVGIPVAVELVWPAVLVSVAATIVLILTTPSTTREK